MNNKQKIEFLEELEERQMLNPKGSAYLEGLIDSEGEEEMTIK